MFVFKMSIRNSSSKMNGNTWSECCKMTIEEIETIGTTKVRNEKKLLESGI